MKNLLLFIAILSTTSVLAQPVITKNPKDAQNCVGGTVLLDVAATGSPLRFQWQRDTGSGFFNIGSLDYWNDSLFVGSAGLEAPSSETFRCVVVDDNGDSAISKSATVTLDSCLAPVADFTFAFVQAEVCFTNTSTNATTVLWNFGNGTTDETNNDTPCEDYGTPWYYNVTLYAFNDHGSDEKTMTIDLVGLEELSSSFDVFPNPTQNIIYIQSDAKIESIRLIDLNGRTMLTNVAPTSKTQINIESLASGVYTMVIASEEGLMYHKVIKQ
jgi:PKD repeat protein